MTAATLGHQKTGVDTMTTLGAARSFTRSVGAAWILVRVTSASSAIVVGLRPGHGGKPPVASIEEDEGLVTLQDSDDVTQTPPESDFDRWVGRYDDEAWDAEPSREFLAWLESQHHDSVKAAWQHLYPFRPFPGFTHEDQHGPVLVERAETKHEWRRRFASRRRLPVIRIARRGLGVRRLSSGRRRARRVGASRGSPGRISADDADLHLAARAA